jgi:hypothetical protein
MQKRTLACMAAVGCAAAIAIPSIALGNARRNEGGSLAASQALQTPFVTHMTGAAEVPTAGDTDGFGGAAVTFDLASTPATMCWDLSYGNLTGTPTAAHIHGPAAVGATAPPVLPFTTATLGAIHYRLDHKGLGMEYYYFWHKRPRVLVHPVQ